jgi:hypothetical protein
MWASILGLYLYLGSCWAVDTALYWLVFGEDDAARLEGFFAAVLFWPYQIGKGIVRKTMGLTFFKELK